MLHPIANEDHIFTVLADVPFASLGGLGFVLGAGFALPEVYHALALLLVDELHQDGDVLRATTDVTRMVRALQVFNKN